MKDLKVKNDRLYIRNKIYILNNEKLQLYLLQKYYNPSKQRYSRHKAMFQNMQTRYYWLNIAKNCKNIPLTLACAAEQKHIIFKNKVFWIHY